MRLIDADALLDDCVFSSKEFEKFMREFIGDAPTIELERKKGKWEDCYRSKWDGTRYWFRACSECNFERDDCNSEKDTMYCPNCGAKMEKEDG